MAYDPQTDTSAYQGVQAGSTPWWQTPGPWGQTPDAQGNYYTPPSGGTYGNAPGSVNYPGNYAPGQPGAVNNAPGAPAPTGDYVPGQGLPGSPTNPATTTPTGGGTVGGIGGGMSSPGIPGPALAPTWTAPTPTPLPGVPGYPTPPAFNYKDFTAPTLDEATQSPGYQFRLGQGEQTLQNSAAARGVLNTGGTLKNILDYGQNAASQEYQNVFNRDVTGYQLGRQNALDTYNTNYQTQYKDPYTLSTFPGYQTGVTNTAHLNDVNNTNSWNAFLANYDQNYNNQNQWWNRLQQTATAQ